MCGSAYHALLRSVLVCIAAAAKVPGATTACHPQAFTRTVQLEPDNGEAWNNIAAIHMQAGR